MKQVNLLQQLKDIHSPPAISMWPQTPGWFILATLIILIALWLSVKTWRWYSKRRRRQMVLKELQQWMARYNTEPEACIVNVSTLLRRIALAKYPRQEVAGLTGKAWLTFLDHQGQTKAFSQGVGQCLANAPYQPHVDIDMDGLHRLLIQWIKRVL